MYSKSKLVKSKNTPYLHEHFSLSYHLTPITVFKTTQVGLTRFREYELFIRSIIFYVSRIEKK